MKLKTTASTAANGDQTVETLARKKQNRGVSGATERLVHDTLIGELRADTQ